MRAQICTLIHTNLDSQIPSLQMTPNPKHYSNSRLVDVNGVIAASLRRRVCSAKTPLALSGFSLFARQFAAPLLISRNSPRWERIVIARLRESEHSRLRVSISSRVMSLLSLSKAAEKWLVVPRSA